MSSSDINISTSNPNPSSETNPSKTDMGTPEAIVGANGAQNDESKKSLGAAAEAESGGKEGPFPVLEPTKTKGTSLATEDLEIEFPKAPGDLARGKPMKPTSGAGQGVKIRDPPNGPRR